MRAGLLCRLVIVAGAMLPLWLFAQENQSGSPNRHKEVRYLAWPYTAEYSVRHEYFWPNGRVDTQEWTEVQTRDSKWRRLDEQRTADGWSSFDMEDPVAGIWAVWNNGSKPAKVLKYPTPVADRKFCWRLGKAGLRADRYEAQFGMTGGVCQPSGKHQTTP